MSLDTRTLAVVVAFVQLILSLPIAMTWGTRRNTWDQLWIGQLWIGKNRLRASTRTPAGTPLAHSPDAHPKGTIALTPACCSPAVRAKDRYRRRCRRQY